MKLYEIIIDALEENEEPLTYIEISDRLNRNPTYRREQGGAFSSSQIKSCVENFPSYFQDLNGRTVLAKSKKWKDLISIHLYIVNTLKAIFGSEQLRFVAAALFFYKRLEGGTLDTSTAHDDLLHSFRELTNTGSSPWPRVLYALDDKCNLSLKIFAQLADLIAQVEPSKQLEILSLLKQLDVWAFNKFEFSIAFEYMLHIDLAGQYKSVSIGTSPQIAQLMVMLLRPRGKIVYDPVCGVGGLLAETLRRADRPIAVKGTDVNTLAASLAFMSLFLQGETSADIKVKNCFSELENNIKYDYIIGDLPLQSVRYNQSFLQLIEKSGISFPKHGKTFSAMILFIISKLSLRGKAVLTVSDIFLSASGVDARIRELLLEEDVVESVISLPANGLRPYTSGKASIIILNRTKPSYLLNKIKFIDAGRSANDAATQSYDAETIVSAYLEKSLDSKVVSIATIDEIRVAGTMRVSSYTERLPDLEAQIREGKAARLGDLVEMRRGVDLVEKDDANHNEGIPYVKIENLSRDILDIHLSSENLINHIDDDTKYSKALISEPVLMVARVGPNLKPTYFKPNKKLPQIVLHPNVISLKPLRRAHVDLEYIYYQLYSAFVQKQIGDKRHGAIMPYISIAGLQSLVIPFMELSAQKEFVVTQQTNIIASERERVEQKLKLLGYEDQGIRKESDIVSTLVHELRPKLVRLHTMSNKLIRIIEKHHLEDLVEYDAVVIPEESELLDLIEPPENRTMHTLALEIETDSEKLNNILTRVQSVMTFSLAPEDFIDTDLFDFLNEYFSRRSVDHLRYLWEVKGSHVKLDLNRSSFADVIDQLLANAERHAFAVPSGRDKVTFVVREDPTRNVAILEYTNNGSPFVLSEIDFISFFHKSKGSIGSGIGGNYIYRVIRAHNGNLEVRESDRRGFYMRIELPLRNSTDE